MGDDFQSRNKIARSLNPEELQRFCKACLECKNLTLERIRELAAEWGIEVSLMSASNFRDTVLSRRLRRLEEAQAFAEKLSAYSEGGAGTALAKGARLLLSEQIFQLLDAAEAQDPIALSLAVRRLSQAEATDRALDLRERELESRVAAAELREREALLRVEKLEAEAAERRRKAEAVKKAAAEAKAKGGKAGLTAETIRELEETINLL